MRILFAVTRTKGPAWNLSKPLTSQDQWSEHADFMNRLAADHFVLLGGPLGDSNDFLLIFNAASGAAIQAVLSQDPWSQSGLLETRAIQPWTILLEPPT